MLRFPQFLTHYKQGSKIQGGDVQQQKKQNILHLQLLKRESPHSQTLQINPGRYYNPTQSPGWTCHRITLR